MLIQDVILFKSITSGINFSRSIITQFAEISVDFLEPFLNPFGLMAQCLQNALCDELRTHHAVEESVAVYWDCEEDSSVLGQEGAWFVGHNDDLCAGLFRHLGADLILGGVPREAEHDEAVIL